MSVSEAPERRLFNCGGLFYPHVVNYCVTHLGHMVVATRGGSRHLEAWARRESRSSPLHPFVQEQVTREIPVPYQGVRLPSRVMDGCVRVDVDEVGFELFHRQEELTPWGNLAAGSLLVLAWETTHPFHDRGPLWQFLRHCRNAAAHGGRFNFRDRHGRVIPVRHPAVWRGLHITESMQDSPLFDLEGAQGLIGPGDPLLLLYDIEQVYPAMIRPGTQE